MIYDKSQEFGGEPGKVLDFIAAALVPLGFNLEQRTQTSLIASRSMAANQSGGGGYSGGVASALNFISQIEIHARGGTLSAKARFSRTITGVITTLLGIPALLFPTLAVLALVGLLNDSHGHRPPNAAIMFYLLLGIVSGVVLVKANLSLCGWLRDGVDALLFTAASSSSD